MAISKVPYPGHGHASGQKMNIWINTNADPGNTTEVFDLIMKGSPYKLHTALSALAYGEELGNYDDAEVGPTVLSRYQ
jgi:hypothetical protein